MPALAPDPQRLERVSWQPNPGTTPGTGAPLLFVLEVEEVVLLMRFIVFF